jgi:hypothetical protein
MHNATFAVLCAALLVTAPLHGQGGGQGGQGSVQGGRGGFGQPQDTTGQGGPPSLAALMNAAANESELRVAVRRFEQDRQVLRQRYDIPLSPVRIARERRMHQDWLREVDGYAPSQLSAAGRTQHAEFRRTLLEGIAELDAQERQAQAMAPLLPFARPLQMLQEQRRDRLDVDGRRSAQTVEDARKEVLRMTALVAGARTSGPPELRAMSAETAGQAAEYIGTLRGVLQNWYTYYYSFDPIFSWWVRMPYEELNAALDEYVAAVRREWPQVTGS